MSRPRFWSQLSPSSNVTMGKSPPLCRVKSIKLRTRRLLEVVPSQDYTI